MNFFDGDQMILNSIGLILCTYFYMVIVYNTVRVIIKSVEMNDFCFKVLTHIARKTMLQMTALVSANLSSQEFKGIS